MITGSDLERAKVELRQNWKTGVNCPCCGQRVQLYRRQIYKTMAEEFIRLARCCYNNDDFHHIDEYRTTKGGDMVKMRYWGLIEEQPNKDPETRSSGYWRLTQKGWDYLRGKVSVSKHAWTYNQNAREFSGPDVTIKDALGVDYDYREIMGWLI